MRVLKDRSTGSGLNINSIKIITMLERKELALVGRGKWGQNYINTIASLPKLRLSPESIRSRDYSELFNRSDIAGVIIASSTDSHFEIAKDFLIRDFNVLIEKPTTKTFDEALELQKLSQEHPGVIVMVGHIQIYDPSYQELKRILPKIDNIRQIIFNGLQSPIRSDSTTLENWGPHPIYLFSDIMETFPIWVAAKQTKDDNVHLVLGFDNGVQGTADIGSISAKKKREIKVVGEEGSISLDWSSGQKVLTFSDSNGNEKKTEIFDSISPLAQEVLEFVECIRTGRNSKTPLSQGVFVMKVIDLAQKSLETGFSKIQM